MNVLIVYAHPSQDSFTYQVKNAFAKGLTDARHAYEISDLYAMGFNADMSEPEYLREANYRADLPLPEDVRIEQAKINNCEAIVFIYPVFWTEAPAKLVGWFDRVWTYGFAYGHRTMKTLQKALVICVTGRTLDHLGQYGHLESMERVMLGDRIFDRARTKHMIILDGTSKANPDLRSANWNKHLATAYQAGLKF